MKKFDRKNNLLTDVFELIDKWFPFTAHNEYANNILNFSNKIFDTIEIIKKYKSFYFFMKVVLIIISFLFIILFLMISEVFYFVIDSFIIFIEFLYRIVFHIPFQIYKNIKYTYIFIKKKYILKNSGWPVQPEFLDHSISIDYSYKKKYKGIHEFFIINDISFGLKQDNPGYIFKNYSVIYTFRPYFRSFFYSFFIERLFVNLLNDYIEFYNEKWIGTLSSDQTLTGYKFILLVKFYKTYFKFLSKFIQKIDFNNNIIYKKLILSLVLLLKFFNKKNIESISIKLSYYLYLPINLLLYPKYKYYKYIFYCLCYKITKSFINLTVFTFKMIDLVIGLSLLYSFYYSFLIIHSVIHILYHCTIQPIKLFIIFPLKYFSKYFRDIVLIKKFINYHTKKIISKIKNYIYDIRIISPEELEFEKELRKAKIYTMWENNIPTHFRDEKIFLWFRSSPGQYYFEDEEVEDFNREDYLMEDEFFHDPRREELQRINILDSNHWILNKLIYEAEFRKKFYDSLDIWDIYTDMEEEDDLELIKYNIPKIVHKRSKPLTKFPRLNKKLEELKPIRRLYKKKVTGFFYKTKNHFRFYVKYFKKRVIKRNSRRNYTLFENIFGYQKGIERKMDANFISVFIIFSRFDIEFYMKQIDDDVVEGQWNDDGVKFWDQFSSGLQSLDQKDKDPWFGDLLTEGWITKKHLPILRKIKNYFSDHLFWNKNDLSFFWLKKQSIADFLEKNWLILSYQYSSIKLKELNDIVVFLVIEVYFPIFSLLKEKILFEIAVLKNNRLMKSSIHLLFLYNYVMIPFFRILKKNLGKLFTFYLIYVFYQYFKYTAFDITIASSSNFILIDYLLFCIVILGCLSYFTNENSLFDFKNPNDFWVFDETHEEETLENDEDDEKDTEDDNYKGHFINELTIFSWIAVVDMYLEFVWDYLELEEETELDDFEWMYSALFRDLTHILESFYYVTVDFIEFVIDMVLKFF